MSEAKVQKKQRSSAKGKDKAPKKRSGKDKAAKKAKGEKKGKSSRPKGEKKSKKSSAPAAPAAEVFPPVTSVESLGAGGEPEKRPVPTLDTIRADMSAFDTALRSGISSVRTKKGRENFDVLGYLRHLRKEFGIMKKEVASTLKKSAKPAKRAKRKVKLDDNGNPILSGIMKPNPVSAKTAAFAGWTEGDMKSRVELSSMIKKYAEDNGLIKKENRQNIWIERGSPLDSVLKYSKTVDPQKKLKQLEPLTYFTLQRYIKNLYA